MYMMWYGTVTGEYAEMFPSHMYRVPIPPSPITSMWQLDPDRVYPDREYPRYTKMSLSTIKATSTLKYEIRVTGANAASRMYKIGLWILPSEYSPVDLKEQQVWEGWISPDLLVQGFGSDGYESVRYRVLKEVFRKRPLQREGEVRCLA